MVARHEGEDHPYISDYPNHLFISSLPPHFPFLAILWALGGGLMGVIGG